MMDEKKKMIVLGALFVVVLGVGAFQMTSGGAAPAPAPKKEKPKTVASETAKPGSSLVVDEGEKTGEEAPAVDPNLVAVAALTARDPFDGRRYVPQTPTTQPTPAQSTALPKPPRTIYRPPSMSGNNFGGPISGPGYAPLPVTGPGGAGNGLSVSEGAKLPPADSFNYRVSGVITGSKNAAVFTDDKGNQRLITAGSSIDGDSQLVSVARGKVTVRHRGKLKTFHVGGDQ